MKKNLPLLLLVSFWMSTAVSANEPLKIGVAASFLPFMENIKPRLSQQMGVAIQITGEKNIDLYEKHLSRTNTPYDLIIFSENRHLTSPANQQNIIKRSEVITSPHVVLWCPYINMPKRVSLNDIITQSNIQSIATPGSSSLLTDIFIRTVSKLPSTVRLMTADNSLDAWRMANLQQVDCAVTFDKWLKPTDQFNYISPEPINIRGWVKTNGRYTTQAKQIIYTISSPLLQPIMMRSTDSVTTSNMQ